jgi:hypothetical protein
MNQKMVTAPAMKWTGLSFEYHSKSQNTPNLFYYGNI